MREAPKAEWPSPISRRPNNKISADLLAMTSEVYARNLPPDAAEPFVFVNHFNIVLARICKL